MTDTFTADNVGNPEPVPVVGPPCREVWVKENAGANTTSYKVREPLIGSTPITKANGEEHVFKKPGGAWYVTGEIVGYIETIDAASATFAKKER